MQNRRVEAGFIGMMQGQGVHLRERKIVEWEDEQGSSESQDKRRSGIRGG